ncbi:hypothetical protein [Paracidovorax wautersii]|nr:hypothetical protein [Paracidovorax wautersii]
MSTTDRLRQVIVETLQIDAAGLQDAIGQLMVVTSAEHPSAPAEVRSVHDAAAGVTVLLADRIPAGREAHVLAAEIERHHGRGSAQLVLGDRADELLGRLVPTNLVVDGLDEAACFAGDGERAPFVVFDVDRQENIAGPFASRDLAAVHRQEILDGHAPRLDALALSQALEAAEEGPTKTLAAARDEIRARELQPDEKVVRAIADADLLAEINRRGILQPMYGAIGAVHDHLDRTGALDERLTQYLVYRLRREEAAITGMPDSAARVANWQGCIEELDREGRRGEGPSM